MTKITNRKERLNFDCARDLKARHRIAAYIKAHTIRKGLKKAKEQEDSLALVRTTAYIRCKTCGCEDNTKYDINCLICDNTLSSMNRSILRFC